MNNIIFICPYFGKFPKHFELWLKSCKMNLDCKWIIYTDDKRKFDFPKNVEVNYCTLADLQKKFSKKLGFEVSLKTIRKLGDYKPLFGFLFEDEIEGFKSWGHLDVNDSIYGQITKIITSQILDNYNKIMFCGHMSIYKNTKENNRMFMKKFKSGIDYKKIFTDDAFYNFEEIGPISITKLYRENNIDIKNLTGKYADISFKKYNMVIGGVKENIDEYYLLNNNHVVFSWENGSIYGYFINKNKIDKKEFIYIHLKRRNLNFKCNPKSDKFIINQNGFYDYVNIDKKYILDNDKKKIFYKPFIYSKINEFKTKKRRK